MMKIGELVDFLEDSGFKNSFKGNKDDVVEGFSSLTNYKPLTLTWIKNEEAYTKIGRPQDIRCAIIEEGVSVDFANVIITQNSKEIFFCVLNKFWGEVKEEGYIGAGTYISSDAHIDETVSIGCNCSIVGKVFIGSHTVIENNVVIQGNVRIGNNCVIQSSVVIGIDGYGYSKDKKTKRKTMIKHFGGVLIGNDVFIGSHSNIAKGTIDDTVIGDGTKIAPSTHIAHNNHIGEGVSIICSDLYGSVKIGSNSYITASTIENQITVGENTVIGMGSIVTKHIDDGLIACGYPARAIKENDSDL